MQNEKKNNVQPLELRLERGKQNTQAEARSSGSHRRDRCLGGSILKPWGFDSQNKGDSIPKIWWLISRTMRARFHIFEGSTLKPLGLDSNSIHKQWRFDSKTLRVRFPNDWGSIPKKLGLDSKSLEFRNGYESAGNYQFASSLKTSQLCFIEKHFQNYTTH